MINDIVSAVVAGAGILIILAYDAMTAIAIITITIFNQFATKSAMKSALSEHIRENKKTAKPASTVSPPSSLTG